MTVINRSAWEEFIQSRPEAHLLQTAEWGDFKTQYGWTARFLQTAASGAQVLFRRLPINLTIAYIPKGPVGAGWGGLLDETIGLCRQHRAMVLYVEPDLWDEDPAAMSLLSSGFQPSEISIQPRRTIVISLSGSEDDWLKRMKQKTRYNIRLASKNGVDIEESGDVEVFNRLIQETGERGEFGVHEPGYYQSAFDRFSERGLCRLMIAKYNGVPLAGLMVFRHGHRAWYFYGASSEKERQLMPAYLLQWEAMRWAAGQGCTEYDLWGVPDEPLQALEENFTDRSDGLWGVYRFKRGFGGELRRSAGVFEKVLNPALYWLYRLGMKARRRSLS